MIFRSLYAAATAALLAAEIGIAAFVHDDFVRPYFGDSLAVAVVYLALRTATPLRVPVAVGTALAVAFAIEFGQWFHLIHVLGLERNVIARCLLGSGFDPWDFVAYLGGGALVLGSQRYVTYQLPKPGASLAPPGPSRVTRAAP